MFGSSRGRWQRVGVRHGLWLGRRLSACCYLQLNPSSPGGWGCVPVRPALSPRFSWEAFLSSHLISCHLSSDVFPNLCLSEYLQSQSPSRGCTHSGSQQAAHTSHPERQPLRCLTGHSGCVVQVGLGGIR